ncbi:MAG: 2-hydroxyacyl-CoA dehydratase [Candidatus Thermoplasmatota archaeon]
MTRVPITIDNVGPEERVVVPARRISDDFSEFTQARSLDDVFALAREVIEDPTMPTVDAWTRSGRHAVASFPVYTPQELVHSLGMLPVTVQGGGEGYEITHADAPLGSFLCSISKSTLEMALTHQLDRFSGFVFPYICDVSRNLEGIFARTWGGRPTYMLHLPQNFDTSAAVPFLLAEYRRLIEQLEGMAGRKFDAADLAASIKLFNRQRELVAQLATLKRTQPWRITAVEHYLLQRLGTLIPREVHVVVLENAIRELAKRERKQRDAVPVLIVGPFCEQPTIDLLQLVEDVGCYVIGDELQMQTRWHGPIKPTNDPLRDLAEAYLKAGLDIGVCRTPTTKEDAIIDRVTSHKAGGVIFLTAKFCEPAGEDLVLYRRALEKKTIPSIQIEFEEKSSGYEQSRLMLETFVESILFE